jgi:hypothetical protein
MVSKRLIITMSVTLSVILGWHMARAHTPGPLHDWFQSLHTVEGTPCCAEADGIELADDDWENRSGHYFVHCVWEHCSGQWFEIPERSVIHAPNKHGRAWIWPIFSDGQPVARCFLPGVMA